MQTALPFQKGVLFTMKNKRTTYLVSAAMLAALITVATAFVRIPTGIGSGYIHLGDSVVYLAASMLPPPYAMCAAAVGGSLADILAGAAIWAPATLIIKALNVLPFCLLKKNPEGFMRKRSAAAASVSGIITVAGYFIAEAIMYSPQSALASIPFNLVQAVGGAVIFCVIAYALDVSGAAHRLGK